MKQKKDHDVKNAVQRIQISSDHQGKISVDLAMQRQIDSIREQFLIKNGLEAFEGTLFHYETQKERKNMIATSDVFGLIGTLGVKRGYENLKNTEGCWEQDIDDEWSIKLNPHKEICDGIEPYHCQIEYNNFPWGILSPAGTLMISRFNLDDLVDALNKAISE